MKKKGHELKITIPEDREILFPPSGIVKNQDFGVVFRYCSVPFAKA
jgi:hypothetical protein